MDQFTPQNLVPASMASDTDRATFIKRTYLHVALAVFLFVLVEAVFLQTPAIVKLGLWFTQGWRWLLLLGGFMYATNFAEKWATTTTDKNKQYLALVLFVIAEAFIFVPLLYIALFYSGDPNLVKQAGLLTLFLFTGLTAVAFLSGKDFSFLRSMLTVGGFIAIGLITVGILFGFSLGIWFSFAMVGLAAGSILYQTSGMIHRYNTEQYVAAALGLFASLMLLFWYILSIFSRD